MLLRRLTHHVRDQNWFAIGIDFVIVVVGVFIGIQVANWNDSRAFDARELELLVELKSEIEDGIQLSKNRGNGYAQAAAAGKRSLSFLADDVPCGNDCWPVLVDFMHASQWQGMSIPRTTFDEMRRMGIPSARPVVEAVEAFYAQNLQIVQAMIDKPAYRSLVRQMIPVDAQESYWAICHHLKDGYESYALDCPKGVPDDVAEQAVRTIANHPQIQLFLTEWTGDVVAVPSDLDAQVQAGEQAMAAIDDVLATRN